MIIILYSFIHVNLFSFCGGAAIKELSTLYIFLKEWLNLAISHQKTARLSGQSWGFGCGRPGLNSPSRTTE